ncbi:ABC transporter ATP-binding protein [Corynebacterium lactis]|uniref:ABC transporter ATP-binding protein n=1 Tax=Corynebacterium lactis RW2-5 TaxID=1408189 RepID=A0A0K2H2V0_9CORY|nr:ABC transporter ATP-binding protein [Corynebacterium lactis]ALA68258.1 ABC transporter ATP-binding protein [Corynebacterium lactis RW2-5]
MKLTRHTPSVSGQSRPTVPAIATPAVTTSQLTIKLGGRTIIDRLDLEIPAGKVTAIIGPNGCGKSTLLKSLCRILEPSEGEIRIGGIDIATVSRKKLSRRVSLMAQSAQAPDGVTVRELVGRGRFPYQSWLRQWSEADERAVDKALKRANLGELANARMQNLSGGQRQRAWLAMVLAQETGVMLLDEPTTYLDIGHQHRLLKLMTSLKDDDRTIVAVLHDLQQAVQYADHLVVMKSGRVLATGAPAEVINPTLLREVFDVDAEVVRAGQSEHVVVLPR